MEVGGRNIIPRASCALIPSLGAASQVLKSFLPTPQFPWFPAIALHPGCTASGFRPLPPPSRKDLSPPVPCSLVTYSMASLPTCFNFLAHSTLCSGYPVCILSPLLEYQLLGLRTHVIFIFASSAVPGMVPHSEYCLILVESMNG